MDRLLSRAQGVWWFCSLFIYASMVRYRLPNQFVPAMFLKLAVARIRNDCPSGKAPTTQILGWISRIGRSRGLVGSNPVPVLLWQ